MSECEKLNGEFECGDVCISKSCACRTGSKESDACELDNVAEVKETEHDSDWSTDSDYDFENYVPPNQALYKLACLQSLMFPPKKRKSASKDSLPARKVKFK
jgi:hypothetical protein